LQHRLSYAFVALAGLVTACADRTSLLVEVSSPLTVPDQVNGLELRVVGDTEGAMVERTYTLESGWPHTVSLRPGAVESQGVTITVTAVRDGAFVARRVRRASFVRGVQTTVEIVIDAECVGRMCPDGVDCVGGRCVGIVEDGGMPDGGRDGGVGCRTNAECDDDVACTTDVCDVGTCRNTPNDSFCQEGFTCDRRTGCPPRTCTADAECNDGVACNGTERCVAMACAPGTPVECTATACTSSRCSESMRGACVESTADLDGDGFGDASCPEVGGVPASDCNDSNAEAFPGAPEVCNGIDDDCNAQCDEAFTCCRGSIGDCTTTCGTTGTRVCGTSCSWGVCSPPPETCNGVDDDCNGAPDDVFACVRGTSSSCTTSCGSTGTRACGDDCSVGACVPPAETCNGADDDCDGSVDEGFGCARGSSTSCMTSCGSTGSRTCDATCTLGACVPPPEGCSGVDDDCDGRIDETVECSPGTSTSCTTSCGTTGTRSCSTGCIYGACTPPTEVCNAQDDDCDGRIDETFTCVPGSSSTCGTSCGTTGTRTCTAACTWGACTPPIEACNGVDDNCNSMCDETFACCAGRSGTCMTSCGTTGTRTCSGSCTWSVCSPPAEVCNGQDDDCNGACDDGLGCCAGSTGSCTTSCGSTGSRTCSSGCAWGSCIAPAETCNGLDDDCDGTVDNGFACRQGAVQNCMTTCGSTGTRTCGASCTFGSCTPPTESCNGVDDDCDGTIDNGCGACSGCTGAVGVTGAGGRYNVVLGPHAQTGSCGGAGGSEAYLTFTLTATSDVFIATHQAGTIDTVVYVRECTCTGTEVAGACNDNADGRMTSRLRLPSLPPGTYNVVVDTKAAITATVPVDVYISAPAVESDRCGNPTFIPAGTTTISGNTCAFNADYNPAADSGCPYSGSGRAQDRVFYFYLPTARTVTFSGCVTGSNYDQTIYVRSVCSDGAVAAQPICNDDGCGGPTACDRNLRSSFTTTLGPGLFYFVADGYMGGTCDCGPYAFSITGL
jgi:hypothetical protein